MTTYNLEMKLFKSSKFLIIILLMLMVGYYLILKKDDYKDLKNSPVASQSDSSSPKKSSAATKNKIAVPLDTAKSADFLMGKFNPAKDTSFTLVDPEYASGGDFYLLKTTYKAFMQMFYAAQHDGVKLQIISATRNFTYQKNIWEQKWSGGRIVDGKNLAKTEPDHQKRAEIILKYSSMPGTSRHHWGTDVDLNNMNDSYFTGATGKKVYDWLCANAARFGFCQPFNSKKMRQNGYEEEKWHWSYLPLSKYFLEQYQRKVHYGDIKGFAGSETAEKLGVIKNYVLSINKDCY